MRYVVQVLTRSIGLGCVAIAGAHLCHTNVDWAWYALSIVGAGVFVPMVRGRRELPSQAPRKARQHKPSPEEQKITPKSKLVSPGLVGEIYDACIRDVSSGLVNLGWKSQDARAAALKSIHTLGIEQPIAVLLQYALKKAPTP